MEHTTAWALLKLVAFHACLCNSQGENWWDLFTTNSPLVITSVDNSLADYYDDVDDRGVCCECVPFYLCDENSTIITDGGLGIINPRLSKIVNVETCPDVTQFCCRPATALTDCTIDGVHPPPDNRGPNDPNTPCDCINWEFCPEGLRITDGKPSTTFIDDKPLEAHSKCAHSLAVCCAIGMDTDEIGNTIPPVTTSQSDCVCVNYQLCGADGSFTDNGRENNERPLIPKGEPCLPPMICCREFTNASTLPLVATPTLIVITDHNWQQPKSQQTCRGIRNSNGLSVRIAGFEQGESQFGEFPWAGMVLKTYFIGEVPMNAFIGGGIIIHPRVILTAAHKVATEDVSTLHVRVGEWDIETDYEPADHQNREVEQIIIHPRFNNRSLYHDLALLILQTPLMLLPHINSICLAASLEDVETTGCIINGWGKDAFERGSYQTVLKSVSLPLVPQRRCQAQLRRTRLGRRFRLHPSFLCAGGERGKDSCSSDGGGPLACPRRGSVESEYLLVGVTAWGIGCGEEGVPGVYANTIADRQWITGQVEQLFIDGHTVPSQM